MSNNMIKNNNFPIDSAKNYLNFLEDALVRMSYDMKIYYDFDKALKEQKANNNHFISWCMRNYYNAMLLKLSGFLESPGTYIDGQTIHGFILELSKHKNDLIKWFEQQTVEVMNLDNGKKEKYSIKDTMLEKLKEINFQEDLKLVQSLLDKIKNYRDKKIGHLTTTQISDENIPKLQELHEIIDELQKLMTKYFSLFRMSVSHEVAGFIGYGDFTLKLK